MNLDTVLTLGDYNQSQSAEATLALNYPEAVAGRLEVRDNGSVGGQLWQRYWPYGVYGDRFYTRTKYNTTWYPWQKYVPEPELELITDSFTPASGWTVTYSEIRKLGRLVQYNVRATTATAISVPANGNITNSLICTITDPNLRPVNYTALASGSTGAMASLYVNADGTVNVGSVANSSISMAVGQEFSATGWWIAVA